MTILVKAVLLKALVLQLIFTVNENYDLQYHDNDGWAYVNTTGEVFEFKDTVDEEDGDFYIKLCDVIPLDNYNELVSAAKDYTIQDWCDYYVNEW